MSNISLGILGFGPRGRSLAKTLTEVGGARIAAIADIAPQPTTQAAIRALAEETYPDAAYFTDVEAFLDSGLDAVVVATPDFAHKEGAVAALRRGIATFVEKPLAITVDDADEILRTAHNHKARLYVGHNMRHMPVVTQMRDIVASGEIGEVKSVWCRHFVGNGGDFYFKDWHADRRYATSLLLQKGAHDIDVIHLLAGGYTRRVTGMGELAVYGDIDDRRDNSDRRMWDWFSLDNWPPTEQKELNPVVDVEDLSIVTMKLDNGVLASYEQCHFTPDYWRNYTVIGTKGRIENVSDGSSGMINVYTKRQGGFGPPDRAEKIQPGTGGHGGADSLLMREFLRFAAEGGATETSPIAAREAVATGVLATESIRNENVPIAVPPLPPELVAYFDGGQS